MSLILEFHLLIEFSWFHFSFGKFSNHSGMRIPEFRQINENWMKMKFELIQLQLMHSHFDSFRALFQSVCFNWIHDWRHSIKNEINKPQTELKPGNEYYNNSILKPFAKINFICWIECGIERNSINNNK